MKINGIHRCEICDKTYASYKSLWNHNKKFHNNINQHSNQHFNQYINQHSNQHFNQYTNQHFNQYSTNQLQIYFTKLICKYCNKKFSFNQSRWVHEKKYVLKNNYAIHNITANTTTNNKIIINTIGNENIFNLSKKSYYEFI